MFQGLIIFRGRVAEILQDEELNPVVYYEDTEQRKVSKHDSGYGHFGQRLLCSHEESWIWRICSAWNSKKTIS